MRKTKGKKSCQQIPAEALRAINFLKRDGIDISYHKDITGIIVEEASDTENDFCDVIGFTSSVNKQYENEANLLSKGDFFPHPDGDIENYYEVLDCPKYGMVCNKKKKKLIDLCDDLLLYDTNCYLEMLDAIIDAGIINLEDEISIIYVSKYDEEEIKELENREIENEH